MHALDRIRSVVDLNVACKKWSSKNLSDELEYVSTYDLKKINASSNIITVVDLNRFKKLTHCFFNFNQISSIKGFCELQNLQNLTLCNNIIEEISEEVGNLQSLCFLDLRYNKIKKIPLEIGKLTSLTHLDMSSNPVERLPSTVCSLSNLQRLCFTDCKLRFLPFDLGKLKVLMSLLD